MGRIKEDIVIIAVDEITFHENEIISTNRRTTASTGSALPQLPSSSSHTNHPPRRMTTLHGIMSRLVVGIVIVTNLLLQNTLR
jgi:hypothetical protein